MPQSSFRWVQATFADVLELAPADITSQSRFAEDLDADSIDLIEVVNSAEREFGCKIEEEQLYDLESVGDLVALIDELRVD